MTTPERSAQQRADALAWANVIRSARADLKRHVRGDRSLVLVIRLVAADPPDPVLETMKVIELLLCIPGLGVVRARSIFRAGLGVNASTSRTLGGLGAARRAALVTALEQEQTHRRHRGTTKGHA